MKIVIIAEINKENEYPHEFAPVRYHHVGYWLKELSKRHEVYIVDWREIGTNFEVNEYVIQSEQGPKIIEEKRNLKELGDVIFIRQSGPMHEQKRGSSGFKFSEKSYRDFLTSISFFSKPVINDPNVLLLAISKEYLIELEKSGLPVIPSLEVRKAITIDQLKTHVVSIHSCREVVVKPKLYSGYGAGVRKLSSFKSNEEFQNYFEKFQPLIAQPVLESIYSQGEFSLIYLGDKPSHSLNKFTGSFLINQNFEPTYTRLEPSEELIEITEKIRSFLSEKYSCSMTGVMRFDYIKKDGNYLLNEIEMINPGLYIRDLDMYDEFVKKFENFLEGTITKEHLINKEEKNLYGN